MSVSADDGDANVEGENDDTGNPELRVLELFSGIGGMHYALKTACPGDRSEVLAAVDISEVANEVYRHNFPHVKHINGNICGLTAKKLNSMGVNAIMMSPPCQPFTRQGLKKDVDDTRSQPLLHVIEILPQLLHLKYILVENVKGFETSTAYSLLIECLQQIGFDWRTFLISPTQLGVPNSRLRCYIVARSSKLPPFSQELGNKETVITDLAGILEENQTTSEVKIRDYLELECPSPIEEYDLSEKCLSKHGEIIDIVNPKSTGSCCFTKSYGRYAEGTGSVLQQSGDLDDVYSRARLSGEKGSPEYVQVLRELRLRYFTPMEVAKLMGFGPSFAFPTEYLRERKLHCYRVLGNSLNVRVVAFLAGILFNHP